MLPAIEVSPPFGIRIAKDGMCSNESGIESSRTFITMSLRVNGIPKGRKRVQRGCKILARKQGKRRTCALQPGA